MRIFKRFALYLLSIALVVMLVSAAFIVPWLNTPTDDHDQALRAKLAGQIDTLIIGQSYARDGIAPKILDEKLNTTTYNLSGSLMPIDGQQYMINKELARFSPELAKRPQIVVANKIDASIEEQIDELTGRVEEEFPLLDVEFIEGGQKHYRWIIGL